MAGSNLCDGIARFHFVQLQRVVVWPRCAEAVNTCADHAVSAAAWHVVLQECKPDEMEVLHTVSCNGCMWRATAAAANVGVQRKDSEAAVH